MSGGDMDSIINELLLAFPTLTSDTDRLGYLRRTMSGFHPEDVRNGLMDYLRTGEKFVETGRFFAIVNRHARQRAERVAVESRECAKREESEGEKRMKARWQAIDDAIAAMPESEVLAQKEMVLLTLKPEARDFLAKRDPRKSTVLKGMIYDRVTGGKGRAA